MNAIEGTKVDEKVIRVLFEKQVIIDYDKSVESLIVSSNVKSISSDIEKVKIQRAGIWQVNLVLIDVGLKQTHDVVKDLMKAHINEIQPAGLHELFSFSYFLTELVEEKFSITAMGDEMFELGVEFIPTIYGTKRAAYIVVDYRDYLPFKKTYFLGVYNCQQI